MEIVISGWLILLIRVWNGPSGLGCRLLGIHNLSLGLKVSDSVEEGSVCGLGALLNIAVVCH